MEISLKKDIEYLEDLFSNINKKLFNSELEKPIITLSPDSKKSSYGWCTSWKAWQEVANDTKGYYEINACPEYLNRPFEEICETLVHEMVHLLNIKNDVKDTSRSGKYHNKKFKETAEKYGLVVEKDKLYGWSITSLSEDTLDYIKSIKIKEFLLYRDSANKKINNISKSSSRKYICPSCQTIIRATKNVRVACADCNMLFEEEVI